jgi:opacity protein-like surface antigen
MRRTLAVSTLILALAAPAQSADKESWDFYKSADEAQFGYGVPESDLITITFRCIFKKKPIELVTTVLPAKPRKGQTLKTTLTNGAVTATYDGKTGHHSDHGYHFVADIPAEPKLLDVLKSGTTLTISVPGGKPVRVPMKGVAKPLAQFESACLNKR